MASVNEVMRVFENKCAVKGVALMDYLCNGNAKDFADYQRICGEIRGLDNAGELLKEAINELDQDNEA